MEKYKYGVWGFYDSYGNKYSGNDPFVLSVIDSITTIMQGACGSSLIQNIVNNPEIVDIKLSNENNYFSYNKDNATYIVYWNPNSNVLIPTTDGMKENIPYVSQAHELQHGLDYISGTGDSGVWITVMDKDGEVKNIKNTEISATHMENLIRAEHGLPLRTHYLPDGNSRSAIIDRQTSRSLYYDCNGNTTFQKIISPNKGYKYKRR